MESQETSRSSDGDTPHYRPNELREALTGEWTAEDRRRVLDHFGRGCPDCWQALDELARCENAALAVDVAGSREETVEPGAPVGRVLERCLAFLATPGNQATRRQRFSELRAMEWHELMRACAAEDPDQRALAFRRLVVEESRRLSLRNRSLLVRLLSSTLEELDDSWIDEQGRERTGALRAVGLVYLADDLRVAGSGREAREKLREAAVLLNTRASDPEARASYYEVAADLACAEEDLEQALTCLANAEKLLKDHPIAERLAETLLRRGLTYMRLGKLAEAVEAFGAALRAIPAGADPRLRLEALHHGAVAEMKRGFHAAAERLLAEAEPLYGRHSSARIRAQRAWLQGVLHLRARRVPEAQSAFWEALHLYQNLGPAGELAEMLVDFEKLCALTGDLDALDVVRARLSQLASRTEPIN